MSRGIITRVDRLTVPSRPVTSHAKGRAVGKTLIHTATVQYRALGVAAPQIGQQLAVFAYALTRFDRPDGLAPVGMVINPDLVETGDDTAVEYEGCLSVPSRQIPVRRPLEARFRFTDVSGTDETVDLVGWAARVWLHEYDHLRGVLITDLAHNPLHKPETVMYAQVRR